MTHGLRRNLPVLLAVAATMCAGAYVSPAFADDSIVQLQGRGPSRDALNAMQYKAFDSSLLAGLKSWQGGEALTPDSIKGQPVLIVGWASWLKGSYSGLATATEANSKFAGKGLKVVAVHHNRGFDGAKAATGAAKYSGLFAHDDAGTLFSALKIEGGGPDYYIIDRAGHLRFAQIDRKSVDAAVDIVVNETADQAAAAKAPSASTGTAARPSADAPGPWKQPAASAYSAARWPAKSANVQFAKDVQNKPLPVKLGKETWITEKPELAGKIIVLDFWATWCGPCIAVSPMLDKLQSRFKDELVIVGMSGQKRPGRPEDVSAIKSYLDKKPAKYSHANDLSQGIYKSLAIEAIPHVVILSTDGVVRWQGNPHDQEFQSVVEDVIKADPGVAK